jgi:hypothetical protein
VKRSALHFCREKYWSVVRELQDNDQEVASPRSCRKKPIGRKVRRGSHCHDPAERKRKQRAKTDVTKTPLEGEGVGVSVTPPGDQQEGGKLYRVILAEPAQVAINTCGRGAQVRSDRRPDANTESPHGSHHASARKYLVMDW